MRNVWMFVTGLAVVVGIGGFVYYHFPKQEADGAPFEKYAMNNRVLVVPAGNPLLTANAVQFNRWFPIYPINCGEVLFKELNPKAYKVSSCINEIATRVKASTGIQLTQEKILDPRVKDQWKVLGTKQNG
jgi:hypothetical protein